MNESGIRDPPSCRWCVVIVRPLLVLINLRVAVDSFLLSTRGSSRFPSARSLHSTTARVGLYQQNSFPLEADKLFDPDLVRALDLGPIFQQVAQHCATHRGRQALLSLVHQENSIKKNGGNKRVDQFPERGQLKKILRRIEEDVVDPHDTTSMLASLQSTVSSQPRVICAVASSAEEAHCQQQTVNQALQLLESGNYPPLYPAESDGPTDRISNSMVTTDDDEWLHFSKPRQNNDVEFYGYDDKKRQQQQGNEHWSLEHILQAEQVVRKIVRVYDWAVGLESATEADILTAAAMEIPIEPLRAVLKKITDTVKVVRVRSFMDPLARSTYSFCLNDEIFPVLQILRKREKSLVEQKQQQSAGTSKSEKILREIADLQNEIAAKEADIQLGLSSSIFAVRHLIDECQNILGHLDVTFAKAAYGLRMMEAAASTAKRKAASVQPPVEPDPDPHPSLKGRIRVENFLHPLLMSADFKNPLIKTLNGDGMAPVPIDLILGGRPEQNGVTTKALIISGPNGGGKTLALKSFGVVCAFSKLGIPIPGKYATVDFFDHILTAVGDQQNVARGESTFTAQLNRYSSFLKQIHIYPDRWHLVLLDELGSGTEENAGGSIGQAVLEALLAANNCRVVATTHSPKLKALSFHSRDTGSAAVLLNANEVEGDGRGKPTYKRPLYKLQYGIIGESQSMNAAQCCDPPFPESVLERAAQLLDGSNIEQLETINNGDAETVAPLVGARSDNGSYLRALTASLERQLQTTQVAEDAAWRREQNSAMIQHAMMKLASAYDNHLEKLERRVENCYKELQQKTSQGDSDPMQILGDTLAEVRLVRKQVKSEEELLKDRGLKRMRDDYVPTLGESIMVVDENSEWNGTVGVVVSHELLPIPERKLVSGNSVVVELDLWSGTLSSSSGIQLGVPMLREIRIFQRYQLAIWDYESVWEDTETSTSTEWGNGKVGSKRRIASLLSKLTLAETSSKPSRSVDSSPPSPSFTSSRERKSSKRKNQRKTQRQA